MFAKGPSDDGVITLTVATVSLTSYNWCPFEPQKSTTTANDDGSGDLRPDFLETMAPYKFITYLLTYLLSPRRICVVTRGFQTTTQDLFVCGD